ncbi:phosphatase PAP2 family protein [Stenotrophomonas sp. GZD-301]|uniref:phosphatase PAP2 family protein n=1 Tax=Stenotrophomonas sp. GZD-301 TaxID=3404814 RepID=UPI003BB54E58
MFQTHWHMWLQSFFDAGWMLPLMRFISTLGYEWAYVLLIVICSFGVRLRAGLGIMLAVLLMSMATHAIKQSAALPRPSDVDIHVLDKGRPDGALVANGAAGSFWALPTDEAIAAVRAQPDPDYGFISGHVGVATAAMTALVLCMGIRSWSWRIALLIGWPLLMALSRMYLGRHFLSDVLGGWLVGMALGWFAWQCLPAPAHHNRTRYLLLATLGVGLMAAGLTTDLVPADSAGRYLGLLLVLAFLHWRGWPLDPYTPGQRIGRVLAVIGLYLVISPVLEAVAIALALPDTVVVEMGFNAIGNATIFMGGIALSGCWPLAARGVHRDAAAG